MFTYKIISNSSRKFSIHTRVRCRSMYTRLALEYSQLPKRDPQPRSFSFNVIQHEQAVHCSFLFLTWRKLEFIPLKTSIFICRKSFQWKSVYCCSFMLNPFCYFITAEASTWAHRCIYQLITITRSLRTAIMKISLPYRTFLWDVTLRYVDDAMDLFSILTRILDGQSLEISPNRWHSLCTPPVFRKTRPNYLAIWK